MAISVMIVDDSRAMRKFMRRVIDLTGMTSGRYQEAGNGSEALRLLRAEPVDVILIDINMPVMNGEQFMEQLAADAGLRSIPVVVVSTDASEHRIERMTALGAKGYVAKPFAPEGLRAELERVLGVRNA